jgi:hypothetical protein
MTTGPHEHEPLDLAAVARDDESLQRLAGRAPLTDADRTDPVLSSLAALVADVDVPSTAGLPGREWTGQGGKEWTGLAAGAEVVALAPRQRRRMASAAVGVGAVAALVLVSGGAAAAAVVTGSPLTPVRVAVHAVHDALVGPGTDEDQVSDEVADPPSAGPPTDGSTSRPADAASDTGKVNAGLAGIGAALASGDLAAAQQQLAGVLALVAANPDLPPGLLHRLAHLQARLERLTSGGAPDRVGHQRPGATGQPGGAVGGGSGTGRGSPGGSAAPGGQGSHTGQSHAGQSHAGPSPAGPSHAGSGNEAAGTPRDPATAHAGDGQAH